MHIVQLANFHNPASGGLRTALDALARQYVARGHRCTLIAPGERDEWDVGSARSVVRVRAPRLPLQSDYRVIVNRGAVRAAIDRLAPDVIELSDKTTLAGIAAEARQTGVPTVMISHERLGAVLDEMLWTAGIATPVAAAFNRRLARRADAIVCASRYAARDFVGHADVHHVPLGVDLDRFHPADGRGRSTPPTLIAVVRLSAEKRPWILVDASRELVRRGVDHRLSILGDGPLRQRLRRSARGLPIRFEGHVRERRRLAMAMATADVAMAPGPLETFGLAVLEMLACGTPVVVPDSGALVELITSEVGVIARSDGVAYADGVELLLAGDREDQRRAARARAEAFTWEATASRMLSILSEVVVGAHTPIGDPLRSYL